MSFAKEASKLLTNKYFLYFMVFLAASNVLGYLVTNKLNAVAFFGLVSFLTYQFSKNMAVILLVAVIMTNFMMANKLMREGLENQTSSESTGALEKVQNTDPEIAATVPIVKNASSTEEVKNTISSQTEANRQKVKDAVMDINNENLNKNVEEEDAPEGFGGRVANRKAAVKSEHFGPRLDYAATIEQSYQNLDSLLGSDSIKQLTSDTQKLMAQQQNLFNTMNQMVPVLEGAQNMLKGFNMEDLQKSFNSVSGLGTAPTIAKK
jgi:hypothetical protein